MGFDIYWSLHRATGLDVHERARAAAHVARWRNVIAGYDLALPAEIGASPDGLLAWNAMRPSHGDPRRRDHHGYLPEVIDDVLDALAELRSLFEGAELAAQDDFWSYEWKDDHWEHESSARAAESPGSRDGWILASELPPEPQPVPSEAAPLIAPVGDEQAIARAIAVCHDARDVRARAGWIDALASRLALDGWEPRPWTEEVMSALIIAGGRSAWRTLAIGADAGLIDAARALGAVADLDACGVLQRAGREPWAAFVALLGCPRSSSVEGNDELASVAACCHAVGRLMDSVPSPDDDDVDRRAVVPSSGRTAIAAAARAVAQLGLVVDHDNRPLLEPDPSDSIDAVDIAIDVVTGAVLERLAPFLVGALDPDVRATWKRDLMDLATSPREMLAPVPRPSVATAAARRPAPAPSSDNTTSGLAKLEEAVRVATTPPLAPPERSPWRGNEIDDLLTLLCDRGIDPDPATAARLALPERFARLERYDREQYLEARLASMDACALVDAVLARLEELHDVMEFRRVFQHQLPAAIARDPGVLARLADLWSEAFAKPWKGPHSLASLFEGATVDGPLFDRLLYDIAAPDRDRERDRTNAAFALIGRATTRRDDAVAALIARIRADRGHPWNHAQWRATTYLPLRELSSPDAISTAILELAEPLSADYGEALMRILVRTPADGLAILERAIDVPRLAIEAARALRKGDPTAVASLRRRWLEHPYWWVRIEAARAHRDADSRNAELIAVWNTIDAARIQVSDELRSRYAPEGPIGPAVSLAPLPSLADMLSSTCADHRAAALAAIDARRDPVDAPALVYGDLLDRALQPRGYRRTTPDWWRWREAVPSLPLDHRARIEWAAAQPQPLPVALARVRDEGADVVAASFPPPYLVLTPEERARHEGDELVLAEHGASLLWG